MTMPPPADLVSSLLPVLPHLAEVVREHGLPRQRELRILLLGVGSGEKTKAGIAELRIWAEVLANLRRRSDLAVVQVAKRALMIRGVPEALAARAVELAKP